MRYSQVINVIFHPQFLSLKKIKLPSFWGIDVNCSMKLRFSLIFCAVAIFISSCGIFNHTRTENEMRDFASTDSTTAVVALDQENINLLDIMNDPHNVKPPEIVGNDQDEHGCIGSAGYVWSKVLMRCARLFEEGIGLMPTGKLENQDNGAILLGYIIFGGADNMYAEFFLPHVPNPIICHKISSPPNEVIWKSNDYEVHKISDTHYFITHFGETIYIKN